jgi:hypothetical protein
VRRVLRGYGCICIGKLDEVKGCPDVEDVDIDKCGEAIPLPHEEIGAWNARTIAATRRASVHVTD